jgi:Flp pilus assembly pilin Flp
LSPAIAPERDRNSHTLIARTLGARGRNVMKLFANLRALVRNDEGQDLLEYALLIALIAIVCFVAVGDTGDAVNAIFTDIAAKLAL